MNEKIKQQALEICNQVPHWDFICNDLENGKLNHTFDHIRYTSDYYKYDFNTYDNVCASCGTDGGDVSVYELSNIMDVAQCLVNSWHVAKERGESFDNWVNNIDSDWFEMVCAEYKFSFSFWG